MPALFFDLDGTLIDSRRDLCATVNHTRRDLGLPEAGEKTILSHVGQGAKHLLAHAIPERAGETDLLWETFRSHYGEHMLETVELYPGVRETLETLRGRGFRLGINTAKPSFATHAILEHFDLARLFGDAVVAGGDIAEMKPSAAPLVECARRMGRGLSAGDWMAGDHWTDMQCAANAGIRGAFCEFGFGFLRGEKCDARLAKFSDILSAPGIRPGD